MSTRLHAFIARFKQRLTLSDLHLETDHVFESAAKGIPDLINALHQAEPGIDHSRLWRDAFSAKLISIAAELTRQTQALECRRHFVDVAEDHALTNELIGKGALVARMFFDESLTSSMSDEQITRMVAKKFIYLVVDKTALTLLHNFQFDGVFSLEKFGDELTEICKISAHFACSEAGYQILEATNTERNKSVDDFYLTVTKPASIVFGELKRDYIANLYLLKPVSPNSKRLVEFKKRTLNATSPFLRDGE